METQSKQIRPEVFGCGKLEDCEIYVKYKEWLSDNGVLVSEKIQFPAYFERGIVGIGTKCSLTPKEIVICVPYHLIINQESIKKDAQIRMIIDQNPIVFKPKEDSEFAILLVFLCRQFAIQGESRYWPYLKICENNKISSWSHWEMLALENNYIIREMKKQNQRIEIFYRQFRNIFKKYPKVFPPHISDIEYRAILEKSYHIIITRSFGWPLPYRSLIPMADSLNHSNENYVNHMMAQMNKENLKLRQYNLSIFQEPYQHNDKYQKKKSKIDRFIEKHKQLISRSEEGGEGKEQDCILWQQYKSGRKFSQLHYYDDSCDEDNDTDEEEQEEFDKRCRDFERAQRQNKITVTETNKIEYLINYWSIHVEQQVQPNQQSSSNSDSSESSLEDETEQKEKKNNQCKEDESNQEESDSLSSTSSDSYDPEDVDLKNEADRTNTYFMVFTKNSMQKGDQLFNFYGRRSNRFLLVGYNFILDQNKYDSLAFGLLVDDWRINPLSFRLKRSPAMCIFRANAPQKLRTREIRLKAQKINMYLINHCRALLLGWEYLGSIQTKGAEGGMLGIKITLPFCKLFEQKVLQLAIQLLVTLLEQYMTSVQQDRELLAKCQKYSSECAIKLRIIYKEILMKQIELLGLCGHCLKGWSDGGISIGQSKSMRKLAPIRDYLISLERSQL